MSNIQSVDTTALHLYEPIMYFRKLCIPMGTQLRSISQDVNIAIDKTAFVLAGLLASLGDLSTLEHEWPSNSMYRPVDDGSASDFGIQRLLRGTGRSQVHCVL